MSKPAPEGELDEPDEEAEKDEGGEDVEDGGVVVRGEHGWLDVGGVGKVCCCWWKEVVCC